MNYLRILKLNWVWPTRTRTREGGREGGGGGGGTLKELINYS